MNNEIKVVTSFNEWSICSEIKGLDGNPIGRMARQIVDLQNEGVRQALIELGWTPPKDKE